MEPVMQKLMEVSQGRGKFRKYGTSRIEDEVGA